jgi:hypothetical protein
MHGRHDQTLSVLTAYKCGRRADLGDPRCTDAMISQGAIVLAALTHEHELLACGGQKPPTASQAAQPAGAGFLPQDVTTVHGRFDPFHSAYRNTRMRLVLLW